LAPQEIEKELVQFAHSLRPPGRPFISVVDVARQLGAVVRLRLHTSSGSPFAQIDLESTPPKILVYRSAGVSGEREIGTSEEGLLTPRERFSVAHELGHWVAFSRLHVGPQSDRRLYWEHERAINAFAGCLLAPDWLVVHCLKEIPEGTAVSPFALRYWATQCRSSEEVIAKALARHRGSIGFLKLQPTTKGSDGTHVLLVLCSVSGKEVSLPKERSHIDNPELLRLLKAKQVASASFAELRLGRCEPQNLRLAWRHGSSFMSQATIWLSAAVPCTNMMRSSTEPLLGALGDESLVA
jgi:hypothetical protein